ncbi:type II toxin-antitoxin system RelE/ParE family toxin (plasmid) [Rhizobium sp. CB3090]|uniref:type II toxin-antitoxin system RelE/ParE family toxin n=1 Tax=Rhizobium sp. CB3090 TaxID=3039156 RepID=UPI0024B0E324|nr:type II toxin-antitoxin system RelE/ParE family toxin [Rhizobium sp. CB3090]WFU12358.1 type II toxin-antitoxin system RelE/ParE family toxin [Rhizobium sp. CB3090]
MMVEFSTEAESDLFQIADFIAQDNPRPALSFVQELRSKCFALADSPLSFPLVPRHERHRIRRRVYGNYLIFYRVDGERVVIVHVLHGAMDYAAILFES